MIFASIDIGSNAIRLLFANIFENDKGALASARTAFIRVPIRLGGDVFFKGTISPEREQKLLKTLAAFKTLIEANDAVAYDAVATSAMREASNGAQIITRIEKELGLRVRIIDGQEEAEIIREAGEVSANSAFPMTMFVDVGGGSTEISVQQGNHFVNSRSFNLGTLRLLSGTTDPEEWTRLNDWLMQFEDYFGEIECVGSGGNINKIAKVFGNKEKKTITLKQSEKAYKNLSALSVSERMKAYNLRADRADVIVPALEIYLKIMKTIEAGYIVAPKIGLADGLIVNLYKKMSSRTNQSVQDDNMQILN
ncbi:MAG: Ppx/GppA family phosphatase [Bacteroidales bacterium]|jgi:exopolyphosphatase/guanosine-5'-triphosphate,3'-diphosphate pyrophosphatase|nr:Ppx/GppA family phosphatase [Bacteroidales bacterium]